MTKQELERKLHDSEATIQSLSDENKRLREKLERMNELLLNAQRAQFGQSSEKRKFVLPDAEQLRIFNEAEQFQDAKAEEPTEKTFTVSAHERKAKRTAEELLKDLPVKEVLYEIPEKDRICGECGSGEWLQADLQRAGVRRFISASIAERADEYHAFREPGRYGGRDDRGRLYRSVG